MIGSKIAHFEITALLGSGGMGEVYRATDTNLGRSVAIKVLPEAFTPDAERLARFGRDAYVLALLNHSSIAAIHGQRLCSPMPLTHPNTAPPGLGRTFGQAAAQPSERTIPA